MRSTLFCIEGESELEAFRPAAVTFTAIESGLLLLVEARAVMAKVTLNDRRGRIMAKPPGRQGDRSGERLQMARRMIRRLNLPSRTACSFAARTSMRQFAKKGARGLSSAKQRIVNKMEIAPQRGAKFPKAAVAQ